MICKSCPEMTSHNCRETMIKKKWAFQRTPKSLFSVTGFALGSVEGRVAIQVRLTRNMRLLNKTFSFAGEQ